jgi:hypothetical protein
MKRPSPTNESIPNIMKFNGFEESILAVPISQFTKHSTSFSWLIDFQPNTELGANIKATKTKAAMIFIL